MHQIRAHEGTASAFLHGIKRLYKESETFVFLRRPRLFLFNGFGIDYTNAEK